MQLSSQHLQGGLRSVQVRQPSDEEVDREQRVCCAGQPALLGQVCCVVLEFLCVSSRACTFSPLDSIYDPMWKC